LLISTLNLEKVGYFCPEYFLPASGNNPYMTSDMDQDILSINSEGKGLNLSKLLCIQQNQFFFLY